MTWTGDIVARASKFDGVTGVVISDEMGNLVDGHGNDDDEKHAILLAYLGEIASSVGQSMNSPEFHNLSLVGESETLFVFTAQKHLVGVKADSSAKTSEIHTEVGQLLRSAKGGKQ